MFTHKTKCILSIKASEDRPVLNNTVTSRSIIETSIGLKLWSFHHINYCTTVTSAKEQSQAAFTTNVINNV